jgi:hypothetical protein
LKGLDGREFPSYTLPELRCLYFDTDLDILTITRHESFILTDTLLDPAPTDLKNTTHYTATVTYPNDPSTTAIFLNAETSPPGGQVTVTVNEPPLVGSFYPVPQNIWASLNVGNNDVAIRVMAQNEVSYKDYHVNLIRQTGITIDVTGSLAPFQTITFTGVPASLNPGDSITISLNQPHSFWYVELNGPHSPAPVFTGSGNPIAFTVPAGISPGFYTLNVIATIGGDSYSGSFSLTVN